MPIFHRERHSIKTRSQKGSAFKSRNYLPQVVLSVFNYSDNIIPPNCLGNYVESNSVVKNALKEIFGLCLMRARKGEASTSL